MIDDEIGKLLVVNKIVCEYCISEWYFYYIAKLNILKCIILCCTVYRCYGRGHTDALYVDGMHKVTVSIRLLD